MRVKKVKQLRMCMQCRERFNQKTLIRLQCVGKEISTFTGTGRSFYVCKDCAPLEKFYRHMLGLHKIDKTKSDQFREQLKEIVAYG